MNKILWTIVIVISLCLISLIYLNRAHAKIQEAIIVAITGLIAVVFGVIFFSGENNEIHKDISVVYFVSLEKKEPLFFTAPVLLHYTMAPGIIWGEFVRQHSEDSKQVFNNIPKDFNALTDLQTCALLQYLSMFYRLDWDIQRSKKSLPGFDSVRWRSLAGNNKDKQKFSKTDLLRIFSSNIFYSSLDKNLEFTLPKGTKISYKENFFGDKVKVCNIKIYKRFAFEIDISLYCSSYSAGLGKIGSYVGLTSPTNKWYVNWDERDKFGTAVIDMSCSAKFFKFMSGNPDVLSYKAWVKNLFEDLYQTFDWSVCDEEMQKYYQELANQQLLKNLGSGLEQKPTIEPSSIVSKQITMGNKEEKK